MRDFVLALLFVAMLLVPCVISLRSRESEEETDVLSDRPSAVVAVAKGIAATVGSQSGFHPAA